MSDGARKLRSSRWLLLGPALAACARPSARPTTEAQETVAIPTAPRAPEDPTPAPPDRPSLPPDELEAELAWAEARWGEQLEGIELRSLAVRLLEWIPPGEEVVTYALSWQWQCKPLHVRWNYDPTADGGAPPAPAGGFLYRPLRGRFVSDTPKDAGFLERGYRSVSIGHALHEDSGWSYEVFDTNGVLVGSGGSGTGDGGTHHGTLSHVDDDVIRYAGQATTVTPECDGPWSEMTCANGETEKCDRCERLRFSVRDYHPMSGFGFLGRRRPCPDECPERQHPEQRRLSELLSSAKTWRPLTPEEVAERHPPSIHRSKESCEKERGEQAGE